LGSVRVLALLWVSVIVFVPGLGAMLALFRPGRLGLASRLAVTFGLGYGVTGLIAYVLTLLRVMRPVPFFVLLVAASGALWYVALRRFSLREQGRAVIQEVRSDPWSLGLGLAVIVGIAAVRSTFLGNFPIIGPYRYWVDGLEIADAGRIPSLTLHYGTLYPPATSKILLNSFNAGISFALGDSAALLEALLWIGSVGLAIALWAVGREMGLRFMAPVLPVLLIANRAVLANEMTTDMGAYKAEIFGRMAAFSALVVGIRAVRDRSGRAESLLAGAMLAVAAGTHLVPVIVVVILLGWYALGILATQRDVRGIIRHGLTIGITLGVMGGAILLLPRGDIGFQGAENPAEYSATDRGFDQTQFLYTGKVVPPREPGTFFLTPRHVFGAYMVRTFNLGPQFRLAVRAGVVASVAGLAVAVWMLLAFPTPIRPLGIAAWGLGASLIVLALAFSFQYDVYVPAWFGIRRLYDYGAIPVVLLGLGVLEGAVLMAIRRWAARAVLATVLLVAVAFVLLLPGSRASGTNATSAAKVVPLFDWIRRETDCDSRILANQRTVGMFRTLTGRVAILEGMGPFLRPDILDDVVDLMLSSRSFFADPRSNQAFLSEHGVDYVVALRKGVRVGYGGPVGDEDPFDLEGVPFLQLVHRTPHFEVFRVQGPPDPAGLIGPEGRPGYRCTREPLVLTVSPAPTHPAAPTATGVSTPPSPDSRTPS
jgi:hypothetical protein